MKHEAPKQFGNFWTKLGRVELRTPEQVVPLFRKSFPDFRGTLPVSREGGFYALKDDAQIMDQVLFAQLKHGVADLVFRPRI